MTEVDKKTPDTGTRAGRRRCGADDGVRPAMRGAAATLVVGCALGWLPGTAAAAGGTALSPVEREVPEFELDALDGASFDAEALRGQPWIVNFWATWCAPCIEELPAMNRARAALEGQGVGMLAVNAGETPEDIETFLGKVPIDFPVLLGDAVSTLPDWQVQVLPTTLVVDADGRVVYEALGPRDWDDDALLDRVRALR